MGIISCGFGFSTFALSLAFVLWIAIIGVVAC